MSYLRNAEHLKIENELRHLFEVNTFDRKDEVQPELRTNGDWAHTALHRRSVEPREYVWYIVCVYKIYLLAIGVKIGLSLL